MKHLRKFNEGVNAKIDNKDEFAELYEEFYNVIAGDWAKHEDDYPYVKQTADDCVKIVKDFMLKR